MNESKAILFDADGLVIKARERFFSVRYAEEHGIDSALMLPFFKDDMKRAFVGEADFREVLPLYLPTWNWKGGVDEFLDMWFAAESPRDEAVLAYINELRGRGVQCYLATDREPLWGEYLKNEVGLEKNFDGFCYSYKYKGEKDNPEFFKGVLRELAMSPRDVMYWDDDKKNVDVAKGVGLDAHHYTGLDAMKKVIEA